MLCGCSDWRRQRPLAPARSSPQIEQKKRNMAFAGTGSDVVQLMLCSESQMASSPAACYALSLRHTAAAPSTKTEQPVRQAAKPPSVALRPPAHAAGGPPQCSCSRPATQQAPRALLLVQTFLLSGAQVPTTLTITSALPGEFQERSACAWHPAQCSCCSLGQTGAAGATGGCSLQHGIHRSSTCWPPA